MTDFDFLRRNLTKIKLVEICDMVRKPANVEFGAVQKVGIHLEGDSMFGIQKAGPSARGSSERPGTART